MNDVAMLIQCDHCGATWDIDRDPDMCTCNSDACWQLIVVDDD